MKRCPACSQDHLLGPFGPFCKPMGVAATRYYPRWRDSQQTGFSMAVFSVFFVFVFALVVSLAISSAIGAAVGYAAMFVVQGFTGHTYGEPTHWMVAGILFFIVARAIFKGSQEGQASK